MARRPASCELSYFVADRCAFSPAGSPVFAQSPRQGNLRVQHIRRGNDCDAIPGRRGTEFILARTQSRGRKRRTDGKGWQGRVQGLRCAYDRQYDHRVWMRSRMSFVEIRTIRLLKRTSPKSRNMRPSETGASQRKLLQGNRYPKSSGHRTLTFMCRWRTDHSASGGRGFGIPLIRLETGRRE